MKRKFENSKICGCCHESFVPKVTWGQKYCDKCQELEIRKCICGCNKTFECKKFENKRFISGHNSKFLKHSEETKELIRLSKVNKPRSQIVKDKLSKHYLGKTKIELFGIEKARQIEIKRIKTRGKYRYSELTKGKMGLAKIGDKNPAKRPEVKLKIKQSKQNISEETKSKMREGMKRRIARGERLGIKKPWFVSELGHNVRSSYEEKVGLFLKRNNICYAYEKPFTLIHKDGSKHTYYMDFILLDYNIAIETKGYVDFKSRLKISLFAEQYPEYRLIVIGNRDYLTKELSNLKNSILDLSALEDLLILTK